MVTKTISISEDVYNKLVELKRANESFSDLLERLVTLKSSSELLTSLRDSLEVEDKESTKHEICRRLSEWRE